MTQKCPFLTVLVLLLLALYADRVTSELELDRYHDHAHLAAKLRQLQSEFKDTARMYSLSEKTLTGKELWVLQIGEGEQKVYLTMKQ